MNLKLNRKVPLSNTFYGKQYPFHKHVPYNKFRILHSFFDFLTII